MYTDRILIAGYSGFVARSFRKLNFLDAEAFEKGISSISAWLYIALAFIFQRRVQHIVYELIELWEMIFC